MESKQKLFTYFHLLLFFFFTSIAKPFPLESQSQSLLSLKSQFTDNSNTFKDWFITQDCCSWSGIKCNKNSTSVISIDLSSKNLSGVISNNHFLVFTDLLELNLSKNSFSGEFPAEIFNLTKLKTLDISQNNFSGNFPDDISITNLKNLILLDALSNSFTGSLPIHLSKLQNLKVLNLAGSYFTGSIPNQYGSFKNLEFLHLGGNLLNGFIPKELGNLTMLIHMEIGYNFYQGMIPWQFGNMVNLKYLDIAEANLSGYVPRHFKNLTKLESLFLFRNHLYGEIPFEFGDITSLVNLDLSDNNLFGTIPKSFVSLKNLKLLNLMYNDLNGVLHEEIAQLPSLDTLFIWNNNFSGSLPRSLGSNSKLRWIDVSSNSFNGEIPEGICSRGVLYKLILFSNNFNGSLSPSLSNCSTLVRIRLEDNSFSGSIPSSFSQFLDLSYIDLSRNNLIGGIPQDIYKARKLYYFNISNNFELKGTLPLMIWFAPSLQNFSASSCSISGEIPKRLSKVSHLRFLDLSYNNLTGSIPSDKLFQSMGIQAYEGNVNLCGLPLKPCGDYKSKKLVYVLVACLASILLMVIGFLGLYYIRRKSEDQWKMVSFTGLPHFTSNDVLRSLNSQELSDSMCKVVLPTGITVIVRKIDFRGKKKDVFLKVLMQIGNARHVNLVRLLGFCYNNDLVYVLYDNNSKTETLAEKMKKMKKKDWETKKKIINGVAKGLCFLHHDCYPAIPHGDVNSTNILLNDDNMEPCLGEFGFKDMVHLNKDYVASTANSDQMNDAIRSEQEKDIYNFGELLLEILTNGKLKNAGRWIQNKPKDLLLREVYTENELSLSDFEQEEVKRVVEVALLCIRSNHCDHLCMEDVVRFLSDVRE